jgi:hypothetical protein
MKQIFIAVLLLLDTGCARTIEVTRESNYITFDHAFTDRGAEEARQRADKVCAEKKQVTIQTSRACSLERCTTSYQCVDRDSLAR